MTNGPVRQWKWRPMKSGGTGLGAFGWMFTAFRIGKASAGQRVSTGTVDTLDGQVAWRRIAVRDR
jgi:hypothetical protein